MKRVVSLLMALAMMATLLVGTAVADGGDGVNLHVRALGEYLTYKPVRKLASADRFKAGEVFDLGRKNDLSPESVLLYEKDAFVRAPRVYRRAKSGGTCAHNNYIVHIIPALLR